IENCTFDSLASLAARRDVSMTALPSVAPRSARTVTWSRRLRSRVTAASARSVAEQPTAVPVERAEDQREIVVRRIADEQRGQLRARDAAVAVTIQRREQASRLDLRKFDAPPREHRPDLVRAQRAVAVEIERLHDPLLVGRCEGHGLVGL